MGKGNRWAKIHEEIRDQILSGELEPGSTIPTNLELSTKYQVHSGTIQTAIKALIQDGLIIAKGRKSPRTVRVIPNRSKRAAGFSADHGKKARKNILALEILEGKDIPESVRADIQSSVLVLYYHNEQFSDNTLLSVSRSYIPNTLPLEELRALLEKPEASLYKSLEDLGHKPTTCRESLIADICSKTEKEELHLPTSSNIPVIRIIRKVFDQNNQLIELCHLISRADCYEFDYQFNF